MNASSIEAAREITRNSKSNLAFAFLGLPKAIRQNLELFYSFCRLIDDLADEPTAPESERMTELNHWKRILDFPEEANSEIQKSFVALVKEKNLDKATIKEIITGCQSDLYPEPFLTRQDLEKYTFRVASCVGLISSKLMGADDSAREFSIALGHALQYVNVIRDIDEDVQEKGRLYFPAEDLAKFALTGEFLQNRQEAGKVACLLEFEALYALAWFNKAAEEWQKLTIQNQKALRPAIAMGQIYFDILNKMQRDGFDVYHKRYSLTKLGKLWIILTGKRCWLKYPTAAIPQ